MTDLLTPVLRLLLAVLLGGIIGFERAERGREAGLRTHIMVCLGACLVMLTSEYIVNSLGMSTDVTRLGAQVITISGVYISQIVTLIRSILNDSFWLLFQFACIEEMLQETIPLCQVK